MNVNTNNSRVLAMVREAMGAVAISRAKCAFFAEKARQEGLENIAKFFEDSARHKDAHFRTMSFMTGSFGNTKENLEEMLNSETQIQRMAPMVINQAMQEGMYDLANKLERLMSVSKDYTELIGTLISQVSDIEVVKAENTAWRCRICGNVEKAHAPSATCMVCGSAGSFDEITEEAARNLSNM